ncbi:mitochondrial ATP synthase g subunit-domain-containing protein [Lineolata rhizophorae]|uniref:Mitochondrial ATP synthase g subunit-domain-containing protein n=1 Tax=Lineolata rhizophorae TaxID=578093 RepID=A0A6A6NT04_9PEZI|nr:mitochondrial ATP synthase g subunit-domain-containing protein [Lineolata rhizophorae]
MTSFSIAAIVPPTIYYSKVGLELGKIVFESRKMSPPSLATFQSYFQPLLNALKNPRALASSTTSTASSLSPSAMLNQLRGLSTQQLASAGVVTAEVIGFFTVGEMLGRFKIVGYRSSDPHGHH